MLIVLRTHGRFVLKLYALLYMCKFRLNAELSVSLLLSQNICFMDLPK